MLRKLSTHFTPGLHPVMRCRCLPLGLTSSFASSGLVEDCFLRAAFTKALIRSGNAVLTAFRDFILLHSFLVEKFLVKINGFWWSITTWHRKYDFLCISDSSKGI